MKTKCSLLLISSLFICGFSNPAFAAQKITLALYNSLQQQINDMQAELDAIELVPGAEGPVGATGDHGYDGATGPRGPQGVPGLACWDLNENGVCDGNESGNDNTCTVADCGCD